MTIPEACQLVLQAGAEIDVVGPVLQQHQTGRMPGQVGRRHLVGEVPGLAGWRRALAVPGGVVDAGGHGAADGELIAGQVTVGRADGHGEPEGVRHHAGVGPGGGALGHRPDGQPDLWRQVGIGQPVPVGHRVPQRDGTLHRGRRGDRRARTARHQHDAPRHQGEDDDGGHHLEEAGAARRSAPGMQPCHQRTSRSRCSGGSGGATLPAGLSQGAAGPGSRCGRRSRRSSTARPSASTAAAPRGQSES